jgi:hypothetical protein
MAFKDIYRQKYRTDLTTRQAIYVWYNVEERSYNHSCCGKAIIITYSDSGCVSVGLGIRLAKHMRHIVICGLVRLYNIFPHYLINDTIFEKTLLNPKCVFWFSVQLLSETFLILWRNERNMIKNVYWSSCTVLVSLFDCNETWIFLTDFRKINIKFHENCRVGAEFFHAYGRRDRQKWRSLIVFFPILQQRSKYCQIRHESGSR